MSIERATKLDLVGWQQLAQSTVLPTGHFVNGELRRAEHTCGVINPANGQEIGTVALGQAADINVAVSSAKQAFERGDWSRRAPRERMAVLQQLALQFQICFHLLVLKLMTIRPLILQILKNLFVWHQ